MKKQLMKRTITSRQLKNILMILMAKNPLPNDMEDMKELSAEFNELVSWKVMMKLDEIEHHRKKAAE